MKHSLKLLPFVFLFTFAAQAAPQSAKDYLEGIYSHYIGDDRTTAKGIFLDKPAEIRRYFTADLAALIIADEDAAAKRNEPPTLDGDPFVDAQDWDIKHLKIHIDSETPTSARATVTFENETEHKVVRLNLVRTPSGGWVTSDIFWKDGSFRDLYKKK